MGAVQKNKSAEKESPNFALCHSDGPILAKDWNMADSASAEKDEMKGGHPPAQKVGGMRVVSHRRDSEKASGDAAAKSKEDKEPSPEDKEEFGVDKPTKAPSSVVVSGAKASDETAYPKEAVKAYHEKPVPTHDKAATSHQKPKVIQQPSKK